ncbi:hypothetical protein OVY48_09845 [Sphingobium sp. SA2]|uniref:hypothetical protein n=1 Tax=Sphingobium sp. SA2 TaxID=1524832 RepID=UPI0028C0FEB8|nr:hypothetical protein [Sphingobium sp. SA2]MDT7533725.1 hypothetical protein [Sphingobium sp. SA2]
MTTVDPVYAQWLMADTLWTLATDTVGAARWGTSGLTKERPTTIATRADAEAEAARQLAFMGAGGPMALDSHLLPGRWEPVRGQVITIHGNRLGYAGGVDVFLLSADDVLAAGTSRVTVLRRL